MLPTLLLALVAGQDASAPFAVDLYKRLAADAPGKNVFCSPYSLFCALALTAEGARGETVAEMRRALRVDDLSRAHAANAALAARLNARSASYELAVANALFADRNTPFRKPFLDAARTHYGGSVFGVDYRVGTQEALRQINAWGASRTRGRIKEVLPTLDGTTRLVLVNAISFKGDWAEPFEARSTRDEDFHLGGSAKARVPIMSATLDSARYGAFEADGSPFATPAHQTPGAKYYPGEGGVQVLEMPYGGGELSMVLLAPRSADGLAALEAGLTHERLRGWIERLEKRDVIARVPKFKLETDYDLKSPLEKLGLRRAFDAGAADFTGMAESGERLFIGQARQKAFVEVNEKGTEAAAVTAISVGALSAPPVRPFVPTFAADRPFAFLIRDRKTGAVLFFGRVADPRKG